MPHPGKVSSSVVNLSYNLEYVWVSSLVPDQNSTLRKKNDKKVILQTMISFCVKENRLLKRSLEETGFNNFSPQGPPLLKCLSV